MLDRFMADVRASLGNGTLQCRESASRAAAAAQSRERLRSELEAEKALLAARLDRFTQARSFLDSLALSRCCL
jgi:hypothetical protein